MTDHNLIRHVSRVLKAVVAVAAIWIAVPLGAQNDSTGGDEIEVLHVRGGVYMLGGAGGNVTVQIGDDGILVVDTMRPDVGERLLATIRTLSDEPIRMVINTHVHPGHTGGNGIIAAAGASFDRELGQAAVIAHENVLVAMSQEDPAPTVEALPTSTYFTDSKDFFFNGEPVYLLHQPNAHTDGDSVVFFRRSDVISTGDIFNTTSYPFIDVDKGGTLQGIIDALNRILELTVPERLQEGGTLVIPGHGRICDESEVVEYRDMLTIIRNSIHEMIKEGRSLREVQRAQPTLGFDVRYGSSRDTTEQFVEKIYHELKGLETS